MVHSQPISEHTLPNEIVIAKNGFTSYRSGPYIVLAKGTIKDRHGVKSLGNLAKLVHELAKWYSLSQETTRGPLYM